MSEPTKWALVVPNGGAYAYTVTRMDEQKRPPRQRPRRPPEEWTAEKIAALRAEFGLSQANFADELGVRQQTVSEWETGRYTPRGATARMLEVLRETRATYDERVPEEPEA